MNVIVMLHASILKVPTNAIAKLVMMAMEEIVEVDI